MLSYDPEEDVDEELPEEAIDPLNHEFVTEDDMTDVTEMRPKTKNERCLMVQDRRIDVDLLVKDNHRTSIRCLCFLTYKLNYEGAKTTSKQGTGIYLRQGNKEYLLTSASNVVAKSPKTKKLVDNKMCNAFVMRKGKDVYYTLLQLSTAHIHPLYTGDPESGFDIAIVKIKS